MAATGFFLTPSSQLEDDYRGQGRSCCAAPPGAHAAGGRSRGTGSSLARPRSIAGGTGWSSIQGVSTDDCARCYSAHLRPPAERLPALDRRRHGVAILLVMLATQLLNGLVRPGAAIPWPPMLARASGTRHRISHLPQKSGKPRAPSFTGLPLWTPHGEQLPGQVPLLPASWIRRKFSTERRSQPQRLRVDYPTD
jgi:hypothetical protein